MTAKGVLKNILRVILALIAVIAVYFGLTGCEEKREFSGDMLLQNLSSEPVTGTQLADGRSRPFTIAPKEDTVLYFHFDDEALYKSARVVIDETNRRVFKNGVYAGTSGTFKHADTNTVSIQDSVIKVDFAPAGSEQNAFTLTLSDLSWNANVSALTSRLTDAEVSAPFEAEDWSAAGGAALSAEASSGPIARILKIQLARTGGTAITGKLTLTDDDLDTMIRACVSGFYPCDTIEAGEIEELDVSL